MGGCIIHFGMHKTGSSSIQRSLSRADDLGPDHCFISSGTRTGNLGGELVTAFADEPWRANINRKRGIGKEELLRGAPRGPRSPARKSLRPGSGPRSSRPRSCPRSPSGSCGRLARALERAAGSVSAVGYVRAPAERMASSFQQRLKGGYDQFDPAEFYPGYRRLEAFDTVFGREQVSMWKFDPAALPGRGCRPRLLRPARDRDRRG